MAEASDLDNELQKLSLGFEVSTVLPIYSAKQLTFGIPTFTDHNVLGSFQINGDKSVSYKDVTHAKLVPKQRFSKLIGMYLTDGFDKATFVTGNQYSKYHELKQEYFLKWLLEHNYFDEVKEKKYKKPDFICFGGRITDPLMSPERERFGDWAIYAVKFQDCIYLWNDAKTGGGHDLQSYSGLYFEHLLTQEKPLESFPNEYEQSFVIHETTFGSHQILAMNNVDAEDENGEMVEISTFKQCAPAAMKSRYLKYWAQSVVPGIKRLIIGERTKDCRLLKLMTTTVDDIEQDNEHDLDFKACLDFEDRLLKWIKSCFKGNDENVVKLFSWICGDARARVEDVPVENIPDMMLPKWFIEQLTETS